MKLSPEARKMVLTAANIVYADEGVQQIETALKNTKSKEGVVPTAAMFATTILHKMGKSIDAIPEEEMWGKMGVVHSILGIIFEVCKNLGYMVPESDLKKAYEMVEDQLENATKSGMGQDQPPAEGQAQAAPPMDGGGMMPGAMPPQQAAPAPNMMGGM